MRQKHKDKTRTVKLFPILEKWNERTVYDLTAPISKPVNIVILNPQQRFSRDRASPLYTARTAFIQFENTTIVNKVVEKLDESAHENVELCCQYTHDSPKRYATDKLQNKTKWVYVANIPSNFNENQLKDFITKECKNVKIISLQLSHHEKVLLNVDKEYHGHAIIELDSTEQANLVVSQLPLKDIRDADNNKHHLFVTWRFARTAMDSHLDLKDKTNIVIVANLHYSVYNDEELKKLCKLYNLDTNTIKNIAIFFDSVRFPLGMAKLTFNENADATAFFNALHAKEYKNLKICVCFVAEEKLNIYLFIYLLIN